MSEPNSNGVLGSLRRLGDLAVGTVQNRVELFAVELREEKCRLIQAIILTAAAIALGVTALTLLTIGLVVLFWENGRVPALFALGAIYALATVLVVRSLRRSLADKSGFAGTLGELEKDRACLQAPN